ncbi:MAG: F0F1 ATP synthase subunit epsilon [Acholeplasmataceae bacterium]|nr:F0F1 ATP synthase subunit epsilon [Acholeplasmataceae bacterium]
MKFNVLTQLGQSYQDEIDYAVIKNDQGEMGILNDHIPIVVHVREGHLKFVKGQHETFLVVEQAVVEFKENVITVLALEAQLGQTLDKAKQAFEKKKKERLELTKKENVDFSKLERELKENIKKSKAGQFTQR